MKPKSIDIRRAAERFHTNISWLSGRHSFSFGPHHDPENTGHGLLLVNNDDIIQPDTGFQTHPHQDMEIVTWVLEGELEHKDSEGHKGLLYPGLAQRMSAGKGIWHSEINPNKTKAVHLVQMWVPPDTNKIDPGYEQLDINKDLASGGWVPVASGDPKHAAISIRQKDATLWAARLKPGARVKLPDSPFGHLFVAKGSGSLDGAGALAEGDAARLTAAGDPWFKADEKSGAEVLLWEMR